MIQPPSISRSLSPRRKFFYTFFFITSLIIFVFRSDIASAINTVASGYNITYGSEVVVDVTSIWGDCRGLSIPIGYNRFIPTKTLREWTRFQNAAPSLNIANPCCSGFTGTNITKKAWGTDNDIANSVTTDNTWNIIIAGYFGWTGTDLFGTSLTQSWLYDIFVSKLDTSGVLLWSKKAWGSSTDSATSVVTDTSGNIIVTWSFGWTSTDMFGSSLSASWTTDTFLVKLNASGSLVWLKNGGGNGSSSITSANGVAVDRFWNIYVVGTYDTDSIALFGTTLWNSWGTDIYVAKLDSSGNTSWVRKAGSTSADSWNGIVVDNSGNVIVTGTYGGSASADVFGTTLANSGSIDTFVAKLDGSGSLLWVKKAWGTGNDIGNSVAIDTSSNIFITGYFAGTSTDIYGTALTATGRFDIFVSKLDPSGNPLWSKRAGGYDNGIKGSRYDVGYSASTDPSGNVYVTGYFGWTSADVFGSTFTSSWGSDVVLAKLDGSGNTLWVKKGGWTSDDIGYGATTDPSGNIMVGGSFISPTMDLFGTTLTNPGWSVPTDIFLAKLSPSGNNMLTCQ